MLKDFLEFIYGKAETFAALKNAKFHDIPGRPHVKYLEHKGELTEVIADKPYRSDTVLSVADLKKILRSCNSSKVRLLINQERMLLTLDDDEYRKNTVTMQFTDTASHTFVQNHLAAKPYDSESFLRILRHELRNCSQNLQALLAVRNVKWTASEIDSSKRSETQDTLGIETETTVSYGENELPEQVTLKCALFSNPGESVEDAMEYEFTFGIEVDKFNKRFLLRVVKDDYEQEVWSGIKQIRDELEAEFPSVPIFYG